MKSQSQHADERRALLRDLTGEDCLLCRDADSAEHHWHTWYVMETRRDPDYRRRVAHAGGFCDRHTRLLMSASDSAQVLPGLLGDLISSALAGTTSGRCDACAKTAAASERRLDPIVRWLDDPEIFAATGRLCNPHLLGLLHSVPWRHAAALAGLAAQQQPVDPSDPDVPVRAALLARAAQILAENDKRLTELSAMDRVVEDLGRDCCPACRSRAQGELRYLSWLLDQDPDRLNPSEPWLCARHLGDATLLDDLGAHRLRSLMHQKTRARLTQLAERLTAAPHPRPLARLRRSWQPLLRRRFDLAAAELRRPDRHVAEALLHFRHTASACSACAAGAVSERRELALLEAAAGHETVREAWVHGHGLCRDHAPMAAPELAQHVLRSRLVLLAWELDETLRTQAWHTRHEPVTPAQFSWPRAVPFLCGNAFLGLTAAEYQDVP
ncbi:hypothetical protein [Amycolatopsis silviterrae]|uniref:Uncharacterized protein n=1 Tax=Amycolatopsis silviterrae TaxID=1656914 RepID=A0ABW5HP78_9PSEU